MKISYLIPALFTPGIFTPSRRAWSDLLNRNERKKRGYSQFLQGQLKIVYTLV
jgi:hypothetical protein